MDLIVTLDDATSEVLSLFLVAEEGTASTFRGLREVVSEHGLFCALYTVEMAKQSPALDKKITYSGKANVYNMAMLGAPQDGSFFRPVSRETRKRGSGPRPHMALCDEVHEHPDGNTIAMLEAGFKFRRQPLLLMLTNSGSDRNSICWAEHEHARKVAHGSIEDDSTFAYVCALDEGDEHLLSIA